MSETPATQSSTMASDLKRRVPSAIGMIDDLTCWAEGEGDPIETDGKRLGVLKPGPLQPIFERLETSRNWENDVVSAESFERISELADEVLRWGRFTLRSLKIRQTFEWEGHYPSFILFREKFESRVVTGSEGFVADVVRTARIAATRFIEDVRP